MREGEKKTLVEKNSEPIFGKVNEGDEIKKHLTYFEKKLMRATKKNKQKLHSWKNIFYFSKWTFFLRMFFISQNWLFFRKSATI